MRSDALQERYIDLLKCSCLIDIRHTMNYCRLSLVLKEQGSLVSDSNTLLSRILFVLYISILSLRSSLLYVIMTEQESHTCSSTKVEYKVACLPSCTAARIPRRVVDLIEP